MAHYITGREALSALDASIARTRRRLSNAIEAADAVASRRGAVNAEQLSTYRALADMRLDHLSSGKAESLPLETEREALELLAAHDDFIATEQARLDAASERISLLEEQRSQMAHERDTAIEAYEARVEDIESQLDASPEYQTLKEAFEEAEAISDRAHSKTELAERDRVEKGAPYDADPLFSYLWARGYGTPAYEAPTFIRFMDGWVADLRNYEGARANYHRLTELPHRLAEHAEQTDQVRDAADQALERAELDALSAGGADILKDAADALRDRVAAHDDMIRIAESEHQEIADTHETAVRLESGPAAKARLLLEDALKQASFPDLRVLASQTHTPQDDELVDDLVRLRTEELDLELSARDASQKPADLKQGLGALEDFRRRFKAANFDSAYADVRATSLDSAIAAMASGDDSADRAFRRLKSGIRRRSTRATPGFGGRRRADTLGLPDILGDIAIEVAKEMSRSGRSYKSPRSGPWRRPTTRRRYPSRSTGGFKPSGRKRGGGFKTGGGF